MLDTELYKNFLLSHIPRAKVVAGGKEILTRCMYCPDSKDMNKGHMYISLPRDENDMPVYFCQKCRSRGLVTYKKLMEWGLYDDELAVQLINHFKGMKLTSYNKKYFDREVYILQNRFVTRDELSMRKINYINNRIGTNLTYEDCLEKKIVLNLNDVLNSNRIENLTRNPSIVNQIDTNFLGFISLDNAFINMRRLCNEGKVYESIDKRYINYSIFNKYDNSEKFYTIPKNIDLTVNRRIQLHIAEGPFDILSVYYNLRGQTDDIYTCIGGNNYIGTLRKFILGMRLPYLEIHLYPDNDKFGSNYAMKNVADFCSVFGFPVYVHRNVCKGEKDFGVRPERIEERIEKII